MIYLLNKLLLIAICFLNKIGRGFYLKKRLLSSERILIHNFKEKTAFKFVQIGANDGVSFDFLYDFVIKRNSSGIVVEPIKEYFDALVSNYQKFPKIIKVNTAIHPIDKHVTIYKLAPAAQNKYPDWAKGIASLDSNHHKKTKIEQNDIVEEVVQAENLMKMIADTYSFSTIDYFQVDTEGFDLEILKMLDFNKYKPAMIKYESVNLSEQDQQQALSLLLKEGYYLFDEWGDTIGIDLHKIKIWL